ncbi:hypothetical protein GCM10009836_37000 [Pseudonocardia ailaonensis]|uniref:Uncharacterized protein n=1 Tax=Pseudonocardia ailaonensis TaxID=367279 RepID=A0ABN2N5J4_9PSEU
MVALGREAHSTVISLSSSTMSATSSASATFARPLPTIWPFTWAEKSGPERLWVVEDCRHISCRVERDLLDAAERIVRVLPKMMARPATALAVRQVRRPSRWESLDRAETAGLREQLAWAALDRSGHRF